MTTVRWNEIGARQTDPAAARVDMPSPAHRARTADAPGPSKLEHAITAAQARDALVGLGWKPAIARTAVEAAWSHAGPMTLDALIREALRRCAKPQIS